MENRWKYEIVALLYFSRMKLQRLIFPKPIILILTHVHYHHYQPYTTVTVNTTICKQCPL